MSTNKSVKFLSPKEFSKVKGLCLTTVYEALRDGSIPSIRISKQKILIPEDVFERKMQDSLRNKIKE